MCALKIRIKFTKEPPVKYLGHLDILRFFQKCFIRANVIMQYSEGFNPHQKLSFALPLGVGITSRSEYLDADVEDGQDMAKIKESLNRVSGEGFRILEIKQVQESAPSLMSSVAFASYEAACADGSFCIPDGFMDAPCIKVMKKTKKGFKETDIKPLIHKMSFDKSLFLLLSAGSENNLKPELLIETLCSYNNMEYSREDYEIVRTGLYGPDGKELIDYMTLHADA